LILLVLALKSEVVTVVTVVVVLACQLGDSFWLRRRISLHSVHIGLLVPWVVALVAYEVYGVGGAAYGLALAVFGLAILDELAQRSAAAEAAQAAQAAEAEETPEAGPSAAGEEVLAPASEPERPTPEEAGVPGYVRAE
jgi:predicted PurR-regulated permease PerM